MKNLRDQINFFLDEAKISIAELAKSSGVSAVNISRVKNGKRKDMSSERADAIRAAMRILAPAVAEKALE